MKFDKKQLAEKAVTHGKTGLGLAVKGGILYVVLVILGLIAGGYGGWWCADHFGYGGWISTLSLLLGAIGGAVGGFFLAPVVIMGLLQDMLLDAGIEVGKIGYRGAKKKWAEIKAKDKACPPSDTPPST